MALTHNDSSFTWCARLLVIIVMSGCSSPKPAAPDQTLWGDMKPVVSVKELMRDLIDPLADNVFDSVSIVQTVNNTVEKAPKTEEDWQRVRIGAVALAEGAYLLKVRRPIAPPDDPSHNASPDAVEQPPAKIAAKIEADPVEWTARIEALRNVGLQVLDIVKRKDAAELWDACENLDAACEACHRSYWYPAEGPQFYKELDDRLRRFVPPPQPSRPLTK